MHRKGKGTCEGMTKRNIKHTLGKFRPGGDCTRLEQKSI